MPVTRERVDPQRDQSDLGLVHRRWIVPDDVQRPMPLQNLSRLWRGVIELRVLDPGAEARPSRAGGETLEPPGAASPGALLAGAGSANLITQVVWTDEEDRRDPYALEGEPDPEGFRDYTLYAIDVPGRVLLPIAPVARLCAHCGRRLDVELPRFGDGLLLDLDDPVCTCGAKPNPTRDRAAAGGWPSLSALAARSPTLPVTGRSSGTGRSSSSRSSPAAPRSASSCRGRHGAKSFPTLKWRSSSGTPWAGRTSWRTTRCPPRSDPARGLRKDPARPVGCLELRPARGLQASRPVVAARDRGRDGSAPHPRSRPAGDSVQGRAGGGAAPQEHPVRARQDGPDPLPGSRSGHRAPSRSGRRGRADRRRDQRRPDDPMASRAPGDAHEVVGLPPWAADQLQRSGAEARRSQAQAPVRLTSG